MGRIFQFFFGPVTEKKSVTLPYRGKNLLLKSLFSKNLLPKSLFSKHFSLKVLFRQFQANSFMIIEMNGETKIDRTTNIMPYRLTYFLKYLFTILSFRPLVGYAG